MTSLCRWRTIRGGPRRASGRGLGTYHPAGGTVDKRIFSITCTTCQARLAVRSEAAIGTIWNARDARAWSRCCRRPGGNPPSSVASPALGSGNVCPIGRPAPLDRVAADPLTLELDLPEARSGSIAGPELAALGVAPWPPSRPCWLVWLASSRPEPEPVSVQPNAPRRGRTLCNGDRTPRNRRRTPCDCGRGGRSSPTPRSPGTAVPGRSIGVKPLFRRRHPPSRPADPKPPQPSPFASVGKQAADVAAGTGHRVEVKKAPPLPVDVAARLADPVAELELTDMPLVRRWICWPRWAHCPSRWMPTP